MRSIAAGRYKAGLMPPWFKKEWLDIEEAPTNTWWRQQGLSAYRTDTSWLGENAPSSSSSGGGDGGGMGGSGSGGAGTWPHGNLGVPSVYLLLLLVQCGCCQQLGKQSNCGSDC
jgi:hypothetical protein